MADNLVLPATAFAEIGPALSERVTNIFDNSLTHHLSRIQNDKRPSRRMGMWTLA
jgi:hypothetical protein